MTIQYPAPGCIVEFLEDNIIQIALVLEESNGKLRLLLPNRRETKLSANRLLPWSGPQYSNTLSKDEAKKILENHNQIREAKTKNISTLDAWELAQGEIEQAPVTWFAELLENKPDIDSIAAYGRALLACKSHFRFQPPNFQIYNAEIVEKKLAEKQQKEQREALIAGGANFLRILWDVASKKRPIPPDYDYSNFEPDSKIANRIENILKRRVANPESTDDENLWQLISHSLPDLPHIPLQLLQAWGKLPLHYNFWLDRADYDCNANWWGNFSQDVARLEDIGKSSPTSDFLSLPALELPFISIDGPTTLDIDDAFYIKKNTSGWNLTIALACPALGWKFGSEFDKAVLHRSTSIYLPEGDLHMLPSVLGTDAFSLLESKKRPSLCLDIALDESGKPLSFIPFLAYITLAANLRYQDVENVLQSEFFQDNAAYKFINDLQQANIWAQLREKWRVDQGAVVMERPDQHLHIQGSGQDLKVDLETSPFLPRSQRIIAELMVLASSCLADWALEHNIPLIHRTQNITIPKEYAGIWTKPEDMARIMHTLVPSILEITPRPHSALAISRYAPITSPLRRYADLVNEAQVIHYLQNNSTQWTTEELNDLLLSFTPSLDAAAQVQRNRPRYWKLLFFQQRGDKIWWNAVITEENENYVIVNLPDEGISVRGKRELFDDRTFPGIKVKVRLGKINPLYNDIHIIEALTDE